MTRSTHCVRATISEAGRFAMWNLAILPLEGGGEGERGGLRVGGGEGEGGGNVGFGEGGAEAEEGIFGVVGGGGAVD